MYILFLSIITCFYSHTSVHICTFDTSQFYAHNWRRLHVDASIRMDMFTLLQWSVFTSIHVCMCAFFISMVLHVYVYERFGIIRTSTSRATHKHPSRARMKVMMSWPWRSILTQESLFSAPGSSCKCLSWSNECLWTTLLDRESEHHAMKFSSSIALQSVPNDGWKQVSIVSIHGKVLQNLPRAANTQDISNLRVQWVFNALVSRCVQWRVGAQRCPYRHRVQGEKRVNKCHSTVTWRARKWLAENQRSLRNLHSHCWRPHANAMQRGLLETRTPPTLVPPPSPDTPTSSSSQTATTNPPLSLLSHPTTLPILHLSSPHTHSPLHLLTKEDERWNATRV